MAKTKRNERKWKHTKVHHAEVWNKLQEVLAEERWNATMGDSELAEAVMRRGVWASKAVIWKLRDEHKVGNADCRKIELFKKQFGGAK